MVQMVKHPVSLLLLGILTAVFFVSLDKTAARRTQSTQILTELESEVSTLQEEVYTLEKTAEKVKTTFAEEKIIRNELLMKKEGEYVVMITDLPTTNAAESVKNTQHTPLQAWKQLLLQ